MVAERYPPHIGGAPFCIHQLSSTLVRLGHRVHVVTSREPNTRHEELIDGVEVFRIDRSNVPRLRGLSFFFGAFRRLSSLSGVYDYDLLHCHNGIAGLVGYRWRKEFEKPYVVTLHGSIASSMKASFPVRALARSMEEFSTKNANASTFDGNSLYEDFLASTGMDPDRAFYIPNAVDFERFSPHRTVRLHPKTNPESINVVYVGRLVPGKGLSTLLDAYSQAREVSSDLSLIVVGEGPYQRKMKVSLENCSLIGGASFLGAIPHSDLPGIYVSSSMVVLPSISEGLSRVLLEAMACEKPVIATDIPANLSLVQDEVNGLIVPLGNAPLLARAILRLAKDKELRRRLGKAARRTVVQEYGVDKRIRRMLHVYEVALGSFRQDKMDVSSTSHVSSG